MVSEKELFDPIRRQWGKTFQEKLELAVELAVERFGHLYNRRMRDPDDLFLGPESGVVGAPTVVEMRSLLSDLGDAARSWGSVGKGFSCAVPGTSVWHPEDPETGGRVSELVMDCHEGRYAGDPDTHVWCKFSFANVGEYVPCRVFKHVGEFEVEL